MKTTVLVGLALFLLSCADVSESQSGEPLSDEELKSRAEVEEITFGDVAHVPDEKGDKARPQKVDPVYRGCILEPGMMEVDSLAQPLPPPPMDKSSDEVVYDFPDVAAEFPGGIVEFKNYLQEHLNYPNSGGGFDFQGTVYVSMVVGVDGSIRDVMIARGVSEELDEEALRVIRSMPNWIPAKLGGKIIAARVRLPIRFTLN